MNPARTTPAPPKVFTRSNRSGFPRAGLNAGRTMSMLPAFRR